MRTKTVKRLAILIGAIVLIGSGGYFLWAFQVERMAHSVEARAEAAEKEGKFAQAEALYRERLKVVPGDAEVQLKYAESLLKQDRSLKRQEQALGIFEDVVARYPGREDARRRAAEVASEIGAMEKARRHLSILLKQAKADGHLEYLMARCYANDNDFAHASEYYASAIEHKAPESLDAAFQRAVLLRDKLGQKDEADRVVDAMVKDAPGDYRAYLGRGRYRELIGGKGGGDDFRKALELAPDRPEIYLELAGAVERVSGLDAAREVLDKGLAAAPRSVQMYVRLSALEQRAGRGDRAVEALELGLKAMPDDLNLRWQMAMLLAGRGEADSGRLLLQIAELERLGAGRIFTQYLNAYYHFNRREFVRAKQLLTQLQPDLVQAPSMKSAANLLLARCYAEMGEVEQQQDAILRAASAKENDLTTQLGWIQSLINRGELDEAIRQYQALYAQHAGLVRLPLASLLFERNRRLPEVRRDWGEAERLVDDAAKAAPGAIEPALLRARILAEQGQEAKAYDEMETIRSRFPKDARAWIAQVDLLTRQRKFDEAQALLGRAQQQLGDRVDLRLARAQLATVRGGPQVAPTLNELIRGLEPFSRDDRRRLLSVLAVELGRQQDLKGAATAWAQLVREEPQSLQPRLQLFELALRSGDGKQAEGQIKEVEKLDEQYGYLCRAQYLAWQARAATEAAARQKARAEARSILTELRGRRPDWSRVALALANLDEEEFADRDLDEAQKREKLESMIASYGQAIKLGQRDPAVVRHYIQLLFRVGRGSEALEFYSQMPSVGQLTGRVANDLTQLALSTRDYHQAEDIARKAVAANPEDFQARVWLAQVLMEVRRVDEAEEVIREGVNAGKADPDRRVTLVRFLVLTRQPAKAEQAVRDAEANLAAAPIAMAQCTGLVGKSFELTEPDKARSWYARARGWFDKAQQALKNPDDLTVKRQRAEFLLQTIESADAEGPLKDIVARTADGKSPTLAAWARRSLAQVYATANPPRIPEALALFAGKKAEERDLDDLRVLALIHEAQGTTEGRRQAIGDLEALVGREAATPEDRRRLAQLLEAVGEWPRAREQFRELILRTDTARDSETLGRRPAYLSRFVDALLRHHQPGDEANLAEARRVVEKYRSIQRDALPLLVLEAQIDKAANHPEAAAKRFRDFAAGADVNTARRLRLAEAAEFVGLFDVAEEFYRRTADEPPPDRNSPPNKARLALFLARHGKLKDAVDLCEGLWADPALRDAMASVCIGMLCDPTTPVDPAQVTRVVGWLEQARAANPQSMTYVIGLGNLYERLGDYAKAEEMYRVAVGINDRDGIASNNLAWLIALKPGLGGKGDEALDLINRAIQTKGAQAEYLDTRGMIYLISGDPRRAVADLEAAFRAAPTPPKYFHLAQAYLGLDEKEKARRVLEAGKTRGLPGGLHHLEMDRYTKLASELGMK